MIHPTRAFYRPGEPVEIRIPGPFHSVIWHLAERIADCHGEDVLQWTPPPVTKRGYRVRIQTAEGVYWTAFDVLERWTDAPRYGYLFDFSPERDNNLDWLLSHHINALQFYDWLYRHDTFLPPTTEYDDPLGRPLSLDTVYSLIDAAHARGMAAMPYTAIYGASPAFAAAHPEWGLYDDQGVLYDFADGFLKIMNPASDWRDHFVRQCQALPFDGIHVDQYGEPRAGFDADGQPVDLAQAFYDTLEAVHAALPEDAALLFNLVHNWPLEAVAGTPVDFLYCELWPPMVTLGDLANITALNRTTSGGRTPVVAVYINPQHEQTVKLAHSVITASGGYHIAHGEDRLYLCDPYFPKSERPAPSLAAHLKRIADFGVAFEELLAFAEPVTVKAEISANVWLIARRAGNMLALNLLNASPTDCWNEAIPARPVQANVTVSLPVELPVSAVWCASPDTDAPPQPLPFTPERGSLQLVVPQVETWTLVCIHFGDN